MKFVLRTSEVKFAHFAEGKLHYPQDNFTYEVNFICPEGKLSWAYLLYRRYAQLPVFVFGFILHSFCGCTPNAD